MPRLEHVLPGPGAPSRSSLVFFFVLKDLGPALVTFFVFLAMFAVARGRPGLALAGPGPDGRRRSRSGYRIGTAAHRRRAHPHVARALGQRRSRRRSTRARALGVLHRRTDRLRPGLGRPGDDSRRQHRSRPARHRRGVGLPRRRRRLRALRLPGRARVSRRRALGRRASASFSRSASAA